MISSMKISVYFLLMLSIFLNATQFPTIQSKTLTNKKITVPNPESNQLLILGFDQKSAPGMEKWVRALDLAQTDTLNWVQIPVIGGVPPFVDGFIDPWMYAPTDPWIHASWVGRHL